MKTTIQSVSSMSGAASGALPKLETLLSMGPERFEDVCAAAFKHSGYFVEPTGLGPDYGIDLIMATIGEGGYADDWVAMRCLVTEGSVTAEESKAFIEALESEGFDRGIMVTTGTFVPDAEEAVAGHGDLQLVDGRAFLEKLAGLPSEAQAEVIAVAMATAA
jgi:restriction endonuclease Mrr